MQLLLMALKLASWINALFIQNFEIILQLNDIQFQ